MDVEAVMLTLEGDEGQQGTALAWTAELPVRAAVAAIEEAATPLLMGSDPLDRPRILAPLWRAFRVGLPLPVIGIVDVALWDLAARDEDPLRRGPARPPARPHPGLRERTARRDAGGLRGDGGRAAGRRIPGDQAPRLRRSRDRPRVCAGRPGGRPGTIRTS